MKTHYSATLVMFSLLWAAGCNSSPRRPEVLATARAGAPRTGDEGMWTLNNLPLADLKARYDFVPTPQWIQHVQLGAVRFNDGGSGAFVSPDGLVITNHHVAMGQLQKLSTADKNYVRNGFFAHNQSQEVRCPDTELNVLVSMQDVTARVLDAVDSKASDEQQNSQRKAEIARIEKESTDQAKLRSDVVELYQGGEYWLYRYKKYTQVNLVMAPEIQAAFFGGDPDNFTYPRHCLDFAFFRVYENDKPVKIEHYFTWSKTGAKEGEMVFVAGHPGSTNRLRTVSQLEFERDYGLPTALHMLGRQSRALREYAARGAEQARQTQDQLYGVENSLKALIGEQQGLRDPVIFGRLAAAEQDLRKQVAARPALASAYGASWDRIAAVMAQVARRHQEMAYSGLGNTDLVQIAKQVVRYTTEIEKPNDQRYEEYRDSALESLELRLFSPAPIYPELEECLLAASLGEARERLGAKHKLIVAALGDRDPVIVARQLIGGTRLADPAYRKELVKGGKLAVEKSTDPLIVWARRLDPTWREVRQWYENTVESVESLDGGKVAKARFAVYGRNTYPDATFTLRLSYGKVAGYESGTTKVPYKTAFYGLFERAAAFDNKPPFDLSSITAIRRDQVDPNTSMNFVTTNDIIGGNSGSPVLNRKGEYVGLIFDGNIEGLVWNYVYDDQRGRAIAVHCQAIAEALEKIYQMPELVRELTGWEIHRRGNQLEIR